MKTLKEITYPVIRSDFNLCGGFIREHQAIDNIVIPPEIVVLIVEYYQFNETRIDSFKFRDGNGEVYDLWKSTAMDNTMWNKCNETIDGAIFVVDLSSYDEDYVDEDGRKWNKLEFALSMSEKRFNLKSYEAKFVWFTNKDKFLEKVKSTPFNICPLFSEDESIEDALDVLTWDDSTEMTEFVDITNSVDIIDQFESTNWSSEEEDEDSY